jgi:hypothetical protein
MSFDRASHSKRKEAAHKTLLKNLQVFQEKIENLADSALIKDEAYRQLSNDNAEMYRQMKQMIDVVSILPTIFQRTILNSEQVQRWVNPAPKNISQGRQKKMNSGICLLCLNELLTLNSHLVALQYHRGHFKYAPKGEKYPPMYCLQMALKRLYIRRLGQRRE